MTIESAPEVTKEGEEQFNVMVGLYSTVCKAWNKTIAVPMETTIHLFRLRLFVIAGQAVDQVQVPPVLRGEGPVAGNFEKFDKFAWK